MTKAQITAAAAVYRPIQGGLPNSPVFPGVKTPG
jgi:hypothetical protein